MNPYFLSVSREITAALARGRPVVGLETTVVTHGLPRPQNLEAARAMEAAVRAAGAAPASVAVLGGQVKVGLEDAELAHLAQAEQVLKVSRRQFAVAVARRADGGTTVAGTMLASQWAGIKIMATGGIGGVHRGDRADVSADLPELARTPVVVVCSGAKAILDLPATLEWLETYSVPVLGYQTDEFPAFYSRESGLDVSARADSASEVAAIVKAHRATDSLGGLLVAVPCPEEFAMSAAESERAIQAALAEAEAQGIRGNAVTPFLLNRVAEFSEGQSLRANLALLENNARIASEIAAALAERPRLRHV